jgi:S-adenosylmethionine:tRNA ribosyltransferase-isomerase
MTGLLTPERPATSAAKHRPRSIGSGGLLDFVLPDALHARQPAEVRGAGRDDVRLMVSRRSSERIEHLQFCEIGDVLRAGDLLVVNTSATRNASLPARGAEGREFELHVSTQLPSGLSVVELRSPSAPGTVPYFDAVAGETYALPGGGRVTLVAPHRGASPVRLWDASLELPLPLDQYLSERGSAIRYGYVPDAWDIDFYQTVYATEPGSAEMASAGRAFTPELITRLMARGVWFAPLVLHTGVSSLEEGEPPYEEYFRVPAATADLVTAARARGGRVIAVGTTAVRAIEAVTDAEGRAHAAEGWTDLVVTPERGLHAVDGLLTGLHEPGASHLAMLEAIAGRPQLQRAYRAALSERYLWHEFGDLHLILP